MRELPEFVDALVGIAQRGRSLGVHLLLATQRPAGAVNDNIRANTNLRIALRVQEEADSVDVIGAATAAAVPRDRPGRGYLRLGYDDLVAFQAAVVTGSSQADRPAPARPFTFGTGARPQATTSSEERSSDLQQLVAAITGAATAAGLPPARRPWPDPLPDTLPLDLVGADDAIGVQDEPERQRQVPLVVAPGTNVLAIGAAGTGTTTALHALAAAWSRGHSPDDLHLYALDFDGGGLAPLGELAHTGAVIGAAERERQERLLRWLGDELARRRALPSVADEPHVVLAIDGYGAFCDAFEDLSGMALRDVVNRAFTEGPGVGVSVVATAERPGAVPLQAAAAAERRLVFRLADPQDAGALGLQPRDVAGLPAGRAVHLPDRRQVQIGLPAPFGAAHSAPRRAPATIGTLPDDVKVGEILHAGIREPGSWLVPIGLGDIRLRPVGLRLCPGDHALVAGPARSGKSTTISAIATAAARWEDVTVTAVALRRSPLRDVASVDTLVTDEPRLPAALERVAGASSAQLLLVDDADLVPAASSSLFAALLARRLDHVHCIAAGRTDALRTAYGHWTQELRSSRQGVLLRPHVEVDGELWQLALPRGTSRLRAPGRGYLVGHGAVELVQAARP